MPFANECHKLFHSPCLGPLTVVPNDSESTPCNIENACQNIFQTTAECEWGPSYTYVNQIKNWKVIHVRFLEPSTRRSGSATMPSITVNSNQSFVPIRPSEQIPVSTQSNSEQTINNNTEVVQLKVPWAVKRKNSLSQLLFYLEVLLKWRRTAFSLGEFIILLKKKIGFTKMQMRYPMTSSTH